MREPRTTTVLVIFGKVLVYGVIIALHGLSHALVVREAGMYAGVVDAVNIFITMWMGSVVWGKRDA